jgi:hypothetical protein
VKKKTILPRLNIAQYRAQYFPQLQVPRHCRTSKKKVRAFFLGNLNLRDFSLHD